MQRSVSNLSIYLMTLQLCKDDSLLNTYGMQEVDFCFPNMSYIMFFCINLFLSFIMILCKLYNDFV